ncbi:MAG TPA: LytTR family DNA-binding domain-containing protein [Gammaproteobacteria bacterium]|nr:LytTR family DNA-binding domain-containing protein [Gammaproteobacteria bacterium]
MRTLIIDDMPLSRARTRRYLEDETDIEVVGECGDGEAAITAIADEQPDLIFLDVQMPGMSGFELLEKVPAERRPAVVFITAFNEFAVPAFEVRAVDYLLKPFDHERLKQALARVRERLDAPQPDASAPRPLSRFAVKSVGKTIFVDVDDVDWIETAGNYLCLHAGKETHLIRETMARLESQLDPQSFARVHRSTIVRLDRIKSMQPLFNGDRCITLHDGTQITMSRSYRDKIDAVLGA